MWTMRRWQGVLLGLLSGVLVGCTTVESVRSTSWLGRPRPLQVPSGADIVQLQVALLERRVGDQYLNERLWPLVDESAIPTDHKFALEQNGFRVGQVGGLPPPELLALLTSERSCIDPRLVRLHVGITKQLLLGPALPSCHFQIEQDGRQDDLALEQAQIMLEVVPSLAENGQIRLHFTPQVEHGERKLVPCAAEDRSGMVLRPERAMNRYSALGWDITLAPNEYVVIGARIERPQSLGYQGFIRADEAQPVQRLLVIRTSRTAPDAPDDLDEVLQRSPPVASQASWSAVRGSAP
jgi:hypothetical protein